MSEKIKNILILLIFIAILAVLGVYGFMTSDFSNLDKVRNGMDSKLKAKIAKKRYYNTDVSIKDDGVISLGDFEINIGNGHKLVANISAKYDKPSGWGMSSGVDNELSSKGTLLRHAIIEAIMNKKETDVRSYRVKSAIIDSMNTHLSSTRIEDVYFNKLIVAE
ncbi:MAG: flagellar basal body-associated FliL family protein [Thiovulaceae bacterium]|nr:flagellar basal body-associated FliL family protein [Sulfurimonadaceae bacterium]